jgi:excisionase family DNA binding protein
MCILLIFYLLFDIDAYVYHYIILGLINCQGLLNRRLCIMSEDRIVLTVEEAAELLGISRPSAYQGVERGEIPHIKIGRRILIPWVALKKLLANAGMTEARGEADDNTNI